MKPESSSSVDNSASLEANDKLLRWRKNAHAKKVKLVRQLSEEITALIDVLGESEEDGEPNSFPTSVLGSLANDYSTPSGAIGSGSSTKKSAILRKKEFKPRNSVLTDLLYSSHVRSVYHIFVAILVIICLNTSVSDIVETGNVIHLYHLELVAWAFGNISSVITAWLCMLLISLSIYPVFLYWFHNRSYVKKVTLFDLIFLFLYVAYLCCFFVCPTKFVLDNHLPPASSAIVVVEQVRMIMKIHAFVRESIQKSFSRKAKVEDDEASDIDISFSSYLYFHFAPTLVYRDRYPRTKSIRWQYVTSNFAQVFACIAYFYFIFARFCFPEFRNFNSAHVTPERLVVSIFKCMLPAAVLLFIGFFSILHSWLNAFAEMMRFADRQFYRDWWNSTSFGQFYRTWNIVVHDWLYSYIYHDVLSVTMSRALAMTAVFTVSAIVHEYILIVCLGFFYPVLFVMFWGAGFAFIFVRGTHRLWNVFLWVSLFSGMGILMCLYSMEWYAQLNCRVVLPNSTFNMLIPRSWFCIRR